MFKLVPHLKFLDGYDAEDKEADESDEEDGLDEGGEILPMMFTFYSSGLCCVYWSISTIYR